MRPNGKITFVSNVRRQGKTYTVYILQSGGQGPLKLEYPAKGAGLVARDQLLRSGNTNYVPSWKLFQAIAAALSEPVSQGQNQVSD